MLQTVNSLFTGFYHLGSDYEVLEAGVLDGTVIHMRGENFLALGFLVLV